MLMDPAKLSEVIRRKKKAIMEREPEIVDAGLQPDLNPNQVYDLEQQGRIESTINSPEKINADDKLDEGYDGVGLSPEEKTRMPRLRAYLDTLDMDM